MTSKAPQIKVRRGPEYYASKLNLFVLLDEEVLGEVPPGTERTFKLKEPGSYEARFMIDGCRSAPYGLTIEHGERITLRAVLPTVPEFAAIFSRQSFGIFVTERQLPEKI